MVFIPFKCKKYTLPLEFDSRHEENSRWRFLYLFPKVDDGKELKYAFMMKM
uniref:Uncharacterized protein n=1 Tax=Octopus bimaculoides TaxID=37653 RepID=A0A0L8IGN7_OCTBM